METNGGDNVVGLAMGLTGVLNVRKIIINVNKRC